MIIRIFTDGACLGNPGAGGWGVVVATKEKVISISGNDEEATNNKMELYAVFQALVYVCKKRLHNKNNVIEIYSDSAYVVNAINDKWLDRWHLNGWKTKDKKDVKNSEIWKEIYDYLLKVEVKFVKVKGHNGVELNEMADKLATSQAKKLKEEGAKKW